MFCDLITFELLLICFYLAGIQAQECGEPKNCIVSEWNPWSECTETCGESGTRTRARVVFQDASCGGSCPFDVRETEPCNIHCCPVDCAFTPWGSWVLCYCTESGCEEDGERYKCTRMREKLSNASCRGYCDDVTTQEACGYLCCYKDCVLSQWSFWTFCDAPCEQAGINKRTRHVTQEPVCGGKACGPTEEYGTCMGECCPVHCVLGEWGDWSTCNTTCGEAMQTRHRFVQQPECKGDPCPEEPIESETRICSNYVNVDCQLSPWSSWTTCYLDNGFCGKGSKYRSRKTITSPVCQGMPCANLTETGDCSGPCCRKDCEVTLWSEWEHCSSSCGQGISNRTRSVISWPSCDGSPCPSKVLEARGCVVTDVIHCEFTDWSNWTTCSNDCGEGMVIRSRSMITPAYCGGSCENELTYEERPCESFTALQNCEVSEWSDWSQCERTCEGGIERRNRTVISNPICGGTECPNITETRSCHELCEQLCTAGVCRCQLGYSLDSNNATCSEVNCPLPRVEYCPETHRYLKDCRYPGFECLQGKKSNATCSPYCSTSWTLTGSPPFVRCREDGAWSQPLIYCARPNDAPLNIEIDNTQIEENTPKDKCVAYLDTTTTDRDAYEVHTYNITDTVTGRLYARLNRVCLSRTANYEEKPTKWNATIHSYDIEGQSVSVTFEFEILNANDPPTSVKLEPNTIPENSPNETVVGCFVGTDDEVGQTITFNMVDSDHNTFVTYDNDGQTCLKVAKASDPRCYSEGGTYCVLNRELEPTRQVTVVATDDGNPPMSAVYDVPIYLSNVNDKQTAVVIEPESIPENVEPGESLVQLIAVDEDSDQRYTFRLLQDANGVFQIKASNLTATKSFDFEKDFGSFYDIEVEATDLDTPTFVVTSKLKLYVQDVNEPPFGFQFSSVGGIQSFNINSPEVQENSQGIIGTLSVMDQDFGDFVNISIKHNENTVDHIELSFTKCLPNVDKVNICTAKVMVVSTYNYEETEGIDLEFISIDMAGFSTTLVLNLDILDMNDPPKTLLFNGEQLGDLTIAENQRNFIIAELSASDDDSEDDHEFEIVDSGAATFLIDGITLKTATMANIDFEMQEEYNITIQVTDNGTPQQAAQFNVTVRITDLNESPASTTLSNNTIPEHSPYGTVVGEFTTSDPDNTVVPNMQHFLYTLSDNSLGRFFIDGNQLKIKESQHTCGVKSCRLDYETEPTVTIKVITMDNGIPRMQREDKVLIHVTDENDPPTDIHIDVNTIKENKGTGELIGTLSSVDEDEDETVTYSVADFPDVFEIKDGNKLFASVPLNYEMLNSYWLSIVAHDNGNPPSESRETVIIHVINVNEKPVFTSFTNTLSIGDDAVVNTSIASFVVSDPDTDDNIDVNLSDFSEAFALRSPNCSVKFLTGATECVVDIILVKELEVEKKDNYVVVITIADKQGLGTNETVTIAIEDVNNSPSEIMFDGLPTKEISIPENSRGVVVSTLSTIDKDSAQTHTFVLAVNPNNYFEVDGATLKITSDAVIDFETTENGLLLQISVQDSGNPPLAYVKNVSVLITDENEPPSSILLSPNTVPENSVSGNDVGNISISDPEREQTHTLKLVNDANGFFILDGNTLKVNDGGEDCTADNKAGCRINYESISKYTLSIEVLDTGTPPLLGMFNVDVQVADTNEYPRNIRLNSNKFILGSTQGTVIGVMTVEDDDIGQTHTFKIVGSSEYISMSEDGQVTVLDSGNLIEGQTYDVTVEATDNGPSALSAKQDVKILVVGTKYITVQIQPQEPAKQSTDGILVKENTPSGTTVAIVTLQYPVVDSALDVEVMEGQSYISITNVQCSNEQDSTTCEAELTLNSEVDYEILKHIDAVIQSLTGDSKSQDYLRITIEDENEAPTSVVYSSDTLPVREKSRNQLLGQFIVDDPDLLDTHSFTLTGDGADVFVMKEFGTLYSMPDADIDYETTQGFPLTLTVTDIGGLTLTEAFAVIVVDVNEAPYGLSLSGHEVNEMATGSTEVGSFDVLDYDSDQTYSFELISDPSGAFSVDGSKLVVENIGRECLAKGGSFCLLDFESRTQHELAIRVTDDGTPPLSAVFTATVNILDVNDPPRAITLTSTKILENRQIGDIIAYVNALDDDPGQTVSFSILDNPFVSIEGLGVLLKQEISFESSRAIEISIIATDSGTPSMTTTAEFIITIIDMNESPISITLASSAKSLEQYLDNRPIISENIPVLSYIGQIVALDEDYDDTLNIESQSMDVVVRNVECIPVSSGTRCTADLRSGRIFDFEKKQEVQFALVGTDKEGLQIRTDITMSILDANDPPTNIYFNGTTATDLKIPENSKDIRLIKLSVEDKEIDQSYVYTFTEKIAFLMISGDEIWITSAADLDYETKDRYEMTLHVADSGEPPESYQLDFALVVTDVNEEPLALYLTSYKVPEKAAVGYIIGSFNVVDPDNINGHYQQEFTFEIPNKDSLFSIDNDKILAKSSMFDYETQSTHDEVILVTDNGKPNLSATFTITFDVTDVNEPPDYIAFSGSSVTENAEMGTIIGQLNARDPDIGQMLIYNIIGTEAVSINGHNVVVNGPLDYEAENKLTFIAQVMDNGSPPLALKKEFTAEIADVNEAPTAITIMDNINMTISETKSIGEQVAKIKVTDEDLNERIEFTIISGSDWLQLGNLMCSTDTMKTECVTHLTLKRRVDYESVQKKVDVTFLANDKGGLTVQRNFAFFISNENDPPVDIILDTDFESIPENTVNFVVGTLSTIDQDGDDKHTYIVISPWELFTIIGNKLVTKGVLDYEKTVSHTVNIRSRDNGIPSQSLTKPVVINVKDVNEAPTDIAISPTEIGSDATAGQVVAQIKVTDPDNIGRPDFQSHTCVLTPTDHLEIDSSKLQIKVLKIFPPGLESYDVTVTCSDAAVPSLSFSRDFSISIVENVDVPKEIQLLDEIGNQEITVDELTSDIVVGHLSVINALTKATIPGNIAYSISESSTSAFSVADGTVTLTTELNFEQDALVYLQVSAAGTDTAENVINLTGNFSIKVIDVNEAPTGIDISGKRAVSENVAEGTFVGDLITYDSETYQTYTYTLLGVNYGMVATENDNGMVKAFNIDGDMLKVGPDNRFINYEISDKITLLINTQDSGEPTYGVSSLVHLIVNDENDPPTDISLSNTMIAENSTADSIIGVFSVQDEDANQNQACELLNLIDVPFKISEGTNLVVAYMTLDYELKMAYTVEVTCGDTLLDGTRLRFTKSFVINVTNVNEPPFNLTVSTNVIEENNLIGQVVGEVKAVDLDSTKIVFAIVEEDDWSSFHIEGDSTLVSDTIFDFESSKRFYTITIRAEDEDGEFALESFEFEITDVNEAPVQIILDNLAIVENADPGSSVGTFITIDPDRKQQFTYSIEEHSDTFLVDGESLIVGEIGIDYETASSYELTITSTDNGVPSKSVQQVITIEIKDANDQPVAIVVGQIDIVPENSTINTVLMTFTVDDPDEGQRHSCHVDSVNDIAAIISGSNTDDVLKLVLSGTLNYEELMELTIHLSCTDGEYEISQQYDIPIGDVNEAPTTISLSGSNTIMADAPPGTLIGLLSAGDEDIGQAHSFILNGPNSDIVKISTHNELTLNTSIPKQLLSTADSSLKFVVTVADNGSPIYTYNQTFTIPITNIDVELDGLPQVAVNNVVINSTFKVGDIVVALFSEDTILEAGVQVELVQNPHDLFSIANNSILVMAKNIDSVTETSFSIEVDIYDTVALDKETSTIIIIVSKDETCFEEQCTENESCISVNDTYHMCECNNDFSRNDLGVCTKNDHCEISTGEEGLELCLNEGVCVDEADGYVCHCKDGFTGIHCEIVQGEENVCANNPCLNGGICVPNEDGTEYRCTCKSGWSGYHCDVTVDDCSNTACYNDGTCIDKHLSFICQCGDLWKGLRCEYHQSVCSEPKCNETHTCVGRVLSDETLCVGDTYLVKLSYDQDEGSNVLEFQARLVDFIMRFGRLARIGRSSSRRKRQADSFTYNDDVEIYVSESEIDGEKYSYSLVVMDGDGEPFTKDAVLNVLSMTCKDINSKDLTEEEFCPSIISAAEADRKPTLTSSSNAGLIAGLIVVFLLLIIVGVAIAVVMLKKKTSMNKINPESHQSNDHEAGSSTGYASMPSVENNIPQENVSLPTVKTIQVLPADSPLNNARYESTA